MIAFHEIVSILACKPSEGSCFSEHIEGPCTVLMYETKFKILAINNL